MHIRSKLLMAALAATLLLALGAGTATASRSFSVVGGGRAILASGRLTFRGGIVDVISDVTLHGSIHSLIAKTRGALVGVINRVEVQNCVTNSGTIRCTRAAGLPNFHLRLVSFTGTLPRITGVLIEVDSAFIIELNNGSPNCLYRGPVPTGARGTAGAAEFTIRTMEPLRNSVPLVRAEGEEFFRRCPAAGELAGLFTLTPAVTLRLH